MKLSIVKGATSVILDIFIADSSSTTGAGLAGLAFNTASLTCYYARPDQGDAGATSVTLATATRGTFTSSGFVEKDATNMPGVYEFGIPNAAIATGARSVLVMLKGAADMAPCLLEIELTGWDNQDGVRGGMTALPNAAAAAAGGLMILGSNNTAAITIGALTTGAIACTTLTASGAVAFQSTFAVTTSTSLGALSCTTLTASGAVAFQSTFAVTTSTSLAALSATTFQTSGTTTLNALTVTNAFTVSGATTLTGAVTASNGSNNISGVTAALTGDLTATMKTSVTTAATAATPTINPASVVASVAGAVGSVTAAVTVGTNNDKTDYALSAAGVTAVQSGLATSAAVGDLPTNAEAAALFDDRGITEADGITRIAGVDLQQGGTGGQSVGA